MYEYETKKTIFLDECRDFINKLYFGKNTL